MVTGGTKVSQHRSIKQPPGLTQPHPLRGGLGFARDQEKAEVGTRELLREQRQRGGSGQSTRGRDFLVMVRVKVRFWEPKAEV